MTDTRDVKPARRAAQTERAAFTEGRILDAAEVAFARRGLAGTRVRAIAEAAGVNSASLYNYYPSKAALYEAVLDRGVRPLTQLLAEFAAGSPDAASVRGVARAVMQHLAERPHLSKLIYHEAISEGDYLPTLARKWFRPLLDQIVGELKSRPIPRHLDEEQFPLVATLFVHLSFGHFALAPLVSEAMDVDPIAAEGIERQLRLIETLIDQLFSLPETKQEERDEKT